jgi:hypothetical protein
MDLGSFEDRHCLLVAALAGDHPPAGRLLGLPELGDGDYWVDIAGASVVLKVKPKTISSWLARSGPKPSPLPRPRRILYRLYWRRSDLDLWMRTRISRGR